MTKVQAHFTPLKREADKIDGLSSKSDSWRMNLHPSNTEPLLQLNLETPGDREAVREHVHIMESLIGAQE